MTGYRVGWTRCSSQIAAAMTKIQEPIISCGVPFAQIGAITALEQCEEDMLFMKSAYQSRRDLAVSILSKRHRPPTYIPGGAFYLPIDIRSSGNLTAGILLHDNVNFLHAV
jgi:aspartate/methionine/tyrosine aminotransferase